MVKLTSRGPILCAAMAVDADHLDILKFRAMRTDSEVSGAVMASKNDPRRTPIGTFLRKYSMDELPQFFNMLTGDMTWSGPRARAARVRRGVREAVPRYHLRHKVKAVTSCSTRLNRLVAGRPRSRSDRCGPLLHRDWSLLLDLKFCWYCVRRSSPAARTAARGPGGGRPRPAPPFEAFVCAVLCARDPRAILSGVAVAACMLRRLGVFGDRPYRSGRQRTRDDDRGGLAAFTVAGAEVETLDSTLGVVYAHWVHPYGDSSRRRFVGVLDQKGDLNIRSTCSPASPPTLRRVPEGLDPDQDVASCLEGRSGLGGLQRRPEMWLMIRCRPGRSRWRTPLPRPSVRGAGPFSPKERVARCDCLPREAGGRAPYAASPLAGTSSPWASRRTSRLPRVSPP